MGTTTFTAYLKPTAFAGNSGFHLYIPLRVLSGIYEGFGVSSSRNLRGLRSYLPAANVPVVDVKTGLMTPQWYAFNHYFVNTYLDFNSAVTINDLQQQITVDQALAAATRAELAASTQMNIANAQATAAIVEVVQTASLSGSTQIPPVVLVPAESTYEWSTGGGDGGTSGSDF
jgi:hypothetical protein